MATSTAPRWSHHADPPEPVLGRQAGVVGGLEILPFGVLVFVAGTLLIVNAWAVIDAHLAVDAAAREAGRAYVESTDAGRAEDDALAAARASIRGSGRDDRRLGLRVAGPGLRRCAVITHEATYPVPALTLPFLGSWGTAFTVHGRHRDVVDPFASGMEGDGDCTG